MIRVMCPHCERTYRTRTEGMGKTAVCTKCHQTFTIGDALPRFEWQSTDLGEDSWIGVPPPEEKPELKNCIICGAPLDEDDITCPECGANQVTGVVHRRRRVPTEVAEPRIRDFIPVRLLVIGSVIAGLGLCLFWLMHAIGRSAVEVGDAMAWDTRAIEAARFLEAGGDRYAFAQEFAGVVTDENLPHYARKVWSARNPDVRRAAELLIGCGDITDLRPLLHPQDESASVDLRPVLHAIGARRLVTLSNHDDPGVRAAAGEALCILFQLEPDTAAREQLAEPMSTPDKIAILNELCRPWPNAVGTFVVVIDEQPSPFEVQIEQIGQTFYLRAGTREFVSSLERERTFLIPVEHWCAATGVAVDPAKARALLDGRLSLRSEFGVSWIGEVDVWPRQNLNAGDVPGFLPLGPLTQGQRIVAPVQLEAP